uniref:ATP synthase subunit a n=1 Tax=Microceramus pontificus TaxID=513540 RepID=A0A343F265_9EUPU|nr:ATP synthase F0 subunit 6 [Microceramus pontificus]ASP44435.1 ATP synthase subunit 6 [Microceramus pontificus]
MNSDLFSSLDGGNNMFFLLPSLWVISCLFSNFFLLSSSSVVMIFPYKIWKVKENYFWSTKMLCLISILLFLINVIGLSPLTYGYTSNLMIVSATALIFWLMFLVSGFVMNFKQSLSHLAPAGAPIFMVPFLVIIETISILIRPLTLTVRLIANISAGHIVLGLIAIPLVSMSSYLNVTFLMITQILYMLFEYFVAVIQAYIFTLLLSLYMAEHP